MPLRIILTLMLAMFVLPAFPQDEPSPAPGDISEESDEIADVMKEAEQGDASAQYFVGLMYDNGRGVPQDYKEAVRWYRAAAEQGHSNAQNNLGFTYHWGQGIPQNYVQAHMWYNLAASGLTGEDREHAATNRDRVAEEMTSEQIAEAQRLASEWKPKTGGQ